MEKICYNEDAGYLEIPMDMLPKGISYARKNNIHDIKIENPATRREYTLDLSALIGNNSISSIFISEDVAIGKVDFGPLYSLEGLTKLTMRYEKGCIDFSRIGGLQTLYITRANGVMDDLDIEKLKDLLLVFTKNTDCGFLSRLYNLENLRISGGNIKSMSGIESLDKLKSIRLDHCANLLDIASVNKVISLLNLYIEKCGRLGDFSFLAENQSIKDLFLSDLNSLSFVPKMKNISSLKFWNLRDGDLSCLLKSRTLRRVEFHPKKRNYTHTKDEINAFLKQGSS